MGTLKSISMYFRLSSMINRSLGFLIWFLWINGTTLSFLIWLVIIMAGTGSLESTNIPSFNLFPAWFLLSLMVGSAQAILLPRIQLRDRGIWVLLTVVGFGLGLEVWGHLENYLGGVTLSYLGGIHRPDIKGMVTALAFASSLSMTAGIVQWLWLTIRFRQHFFKALLWIPANVLGIGLSWLAFIVGMSQPDGDGESLLIGILIVIAANAIPGTVLVWLLQQTDFVRRKRRSTFHETVSEL